MITVQMVKHLRMHGVGKVLLLLKAFIIPFESGTSLAAIDNHRSSVQTHLVAAVHICSGHTF